MYVLSFLFVSRLLELTIIADDDYAVYKLAQALNKSSEIIERFYKRAKLNPFLIFNDETGFMEARNQDGSWAGEDRGWTEGKKVSNFLRFLPLFAGMFHFFRLSHVPCFHVTSFPWPSS